jgi:hypothetical protein
VEEMPQAYFEYTYATRNTLAANTYVLCLTEEDSGMLTSYVVVNFCIYGHEEEKKGTSGG